MHEIRARNTNEFLARFRTLLPKVLYILIRVLGSDHFPCSDRGICHCDHEDPEGNAYCECDEGFHGENCELSNLKDDLNEIPSECLNPETNESCSGLGSCVKMSMDPAWCDCDFVNVDGEKVHDINSPDGKERLQYNFVDVLSTNILVTDFY